MRAYKFLVMLILCLLLVCGCSDTSASYKIMSKQVPFKSVEFPLEDMVAIPSPDGFFTGLFIVYREETGTKFSESWYKNGKRDGLATWYTRDGDIIFQCIYSNGLPWMGSPWDPADLTDDFPIYIGGRKVIAYQTAEDSERKPAAEDPVPPTQ